MATIHLERMGDFYEAFNEDAKELAKTLGITLTKRRDIPMAGFPVRAAGDYISRLGEAGFTVTINRPIR